MQLQGIKIGLPDIAFAQRFPTLCYTVCYALISACTAIAGQTFTWLGLPPVSIHQWRQADGASIAWHYARQIDFAEARIFNLFAGDNHALGEFPLLYWCAGWIEKWAGWPAYPLRWIGFSLLLTSGWAFGWMLLRQTRQVLLAAFGAGLLLTAPLLGYYGPGFMPDAPAFCFVLLMATSLYQAVASNRTAWFVLAHIFGVMAILLKLSMAIAPIALVIAWFWQFWQGNKQLILKPWLIPIILSVSIAALLLGELWIFQFNARHHATYFLAATRPVWLYDPAFIGQTLQLILYRGLPVYGSIGLYGACLAGAWAAFRAREKLSAFERHTLLWMALGSLLYGALWFRMFREHDYYVICLLIWPATCLYWGIPALQKMVGTRLLVLLLAAGWLMGLAHQYVVLSKRMEKVARPENALGLPANAFLSEQRLTLAGIPDTARIVCPEDPSPNTFLFALKRNGWSAYNFGDRWSADTLSRYRRELGLTHLALRDTASYTPLFRECFPQKIWEGEGWNLYGY